MAVANDTGFCNGGAGYIAIDLEKGTKNAATRFKNFVEDGEEIYPYAQKLISHDGLLWASISSGGKNFIAAIDPQTGNYAWKQFIDVYGLMMEPLFFGNYMLLKSDGGDIVVMEKTNS